MPVVNGVGYSEHTPEKIEHLQAILSMHIAITAAVRQRRRYWQQTRYHYIDATAGTGYCPDPKHCDLKGSPLVFLDVVDDRLPFRADFIERCAENLQTLTDHIGGLPHVHPHGGEYERVVPELLRTVHEPLGLMFVDPSGELPDFHTLQLVARKRKYLEILCYLSAANVKRVRCSTQEKQSQRQLIDHLTSIDKRYWLVREPVGKHQWTFILGSNSDLFKNYKRIGFYRADSKRGREILAHINYTRKELEEWRQPVLPLT